MEAKYRAQMIVLKRALLEKKDALKRLEDYSLPIDHLMGAFSHRLTFSSIDKFLNFISRVIEALAIDLQVSGRVQQEMPFVVLHQLQQKLRYCLANSYGNNLPLKLRL
jgi:hypothetical protein